ncbi:unnamed protein product [Linum trigynum]|uniref:Uncharacterized protein n=1 Tax=Linum trigynum TaxID=586398 RepID=A0AAV2GIM5_9ROSI
MDNTRGTQGYTVSRFVVLVEDESEDNTSSGNAQNNVIEGERQYTVDGSNHTQQKSAHWQMTQKWVPKQPDNTSRDIQKNPALVEEADVGRPKPPLGVDASMEVEPSMDEVNQALHHESIATIPMAMERTNDMEQENTKAKKPPDIIPPTSLDPHVVSKLPTNGNREEADKSRHGEGLQEGTPQVLQQ